MKITAAVLVLVYGTAAYIERTEYRGTIVAARLVEDGEAGLQKRDCTYDNCLYAMIARPSAASAFCHTYTTATSTAATPFTDCPTATQASAACSCFAPVRVLPY